jgi:hypothetical protein
MKNKMILKFIFVLVLVVIQSILSGLSANDGINDNKILEAKGSISVDIVKPLTMTVVQTSDYLGRFKSKDTVHHPINNREITMEFSGIDGRTLLITIIIRVTSAAVRIEQLAFESEDGSTYGEVAGEFYGDETMRKYTITADLDDKGELLLYVSPRTIIAGLDSNPDEDVSFFIEEIKYSYQI